MVTLLDWVVFVIEEMPIINWSPPTNRFLSIPTPPSTVNAPVSVLIDCVVFVISTVLLTFKAPFMMTKSFIFSSLLKVTGPSNWERTVLEFPPSTSNLSLIITSSNTTLNLDGSSPVTVGLGISNVVCSPLVAEYLVFPI